MTTSKQDKVCFQQHNPQPGAARPGQNDQWQGNKSGQPFQGNTQRNNPQQGRQGNIQKNPPAGGARKS